MLTVRANGKSYQVDADGKDALELSRVIRNAIKETRARKPNSLNAVSMMLALDGAIERGDAKAIQRLAGRIKRAQK